jgi:hypothetical protein
MNTNAYMLNLGLAWLWIVLGIGSGCLLGWRFHQESWLGGYGSLRRRLYRLGHISFFGLALLNLVFYFTARELDLGSWLGTIGSWGFALGAITMPLCCLVMAHWPKWHLLFAVPVSSLATAALATCWALANRLTL